MLEAKLAQASLLKKIIEAIKDLVQDASFDCNDGGLMLQAMDTSHVALVSLKLETAGFETFRCDRTQALGINLATLTKILKCAGPDDTVELMYQDDGDTVKITMEDTKRDKQQECELKLMDLETEQLGIPDQEYAAKVTMSSSEFTKAVRDLSMFSDSLGITVTKAGVNFSGKGDTGSHNIRWGQSSASDDPDSSVKIEMSEPVNISFAIKYMQHFIKAAPLDGRVTLSLSSDVPIVVEYRIGSSEADEQGCGHLRYYLAPKIDDEAEMPDN